MVESHHTERPYVPSTRTEDRQPAKTPVQMEVTERLQLMIVRIGDEKRELKEEHLLKLHQFAVQHEKSQSDIISSHLAKSICLLTHKTHYYAAVVASIATESESLARKICQKVMEEVQFAIKGDSTRDNAICCFAAMRFFATIVDLNLLSNLFFGDLVKSLLDQAEKNKQSQDFYLEMVLNGLQFSFDEQKQESETLVARLSDQMTKRNKSYHKIDKLNDIFTEETTDDLLDLKFKQFISEKVTPRESLFVSDEMRKDLRQKLQQPLKSLTPLTFNDAQSIKYYSPRYIKLGQEQDQATLLAFELVSEILSQFGSSFQLATKAISTLCLPNKSASISVIVSSALYSELLRLPIVSQKPIFYAKVAETLTSLIPKFEQTLQTHIESLVNSNPNMDFECQNRLIDFYSFYFVAKGQACNLGIFTNYPTELEESDSRLSFLSQTISSMVRKSYSKKVKEILPEELHSLMPPDRLDPCYTYFKEESDNPDAAIVLDKINSKLDIEVLQAFLNDQTNFNSPIEKIKDIFLEALLKRTQRSVEHVRRLADHYITILQGFYHQQPESQVAALTLLCNFWKSNKVRAVQIIDRFIDLKLFDFSNVIKYVFIQLSQVNSIESNFETEFAILRDLVGKICQQDQMLNQQIKFQKAAVTHVVAPEQIDELTQTLERVPFERERNILLILDSFNTALTDISASISEHKDKASDLVKMELFLTLRETLTFWASFKEKARDVCSKTPVGKQVITMFQD